jgi:hypothetical protein
MILIPYSLAPAAEGSVIASCILLGSEALVEPIEACLPEPPVGIEPVDGVLQRLGAQSRRAQFPAARMSV